jgi:hypothetical protein
MILEKGMYLYPAFEAKHLANCGLRKPLCAITFQRQRFKRNTRGILALRSNLPGKFVWYLEDDFHVSRIAPLILGRDYHFNGILVVIHKHYPL